MAGETLYNEARRILDTSWSQSIETSEGETAIGAEALPEVTGRHPCAKELYFENCREEVVAGWWRWGVDEHQLRGKRPLWPRCGIMGLLFTPDD